MHPTKQFSNKKLLKLNQQLEIENQQLSNELLQQLYLSTSLLLRFNKLVQLTNFPDPDSIQIDPRELPQYLSQFYPDIKHSLFNS